MLAQRKAVHLLESTVSTIEGPKRARLNGVPLPLLGASSSASF